MQCREILFTPRCSPRARKFPSSLNFSLRCTIVELQGVKVAKFSDSGLFPYTKPPKRTFLWPACSPEWFRLFHVVVINPKGSFRDRRFPTTSGRGAGECGPQTCPNFRLWQMAIPIVVVVFIGRNATTRGVRSGPQMSETRISEDGCTFPPNIFAHTPKITPKPHFRKPFNGKPIIQRALRQSHANRATTLKLYGYIGMSKYLGWVKNFPLGVSGMRRAP